MLHIQGTVVMDTMMLDADKHKSVGCHPLHRVDQGIVQPGLKHLQGWGIHNLYGQPVPVPHHTPSEEFPPNI